MMEAQQGSKKNIERMSSIELEPRTLMLELEDARVEALYVLSTKTGEEALEIFTEGLEPVLGVGNKNKMDFSGDAEYLDDLPMEPMRFSLLKKMKDIASAPF